jgi:hypothetical protein
MSSCSESIKDYLFTQEKIKNNMIKLKDECPDKVLQFMLSRESKTTIKKLIDCTWSDFTDKKYLLKLIKQKCEDL